MGETLPLIWRRFPERYALIGSRCEKCGQEFFPRRVICPKCRRKGRLTNKKMPRKGKIVSFSEVFVGPAGFEHETPYFIALIELENKVRLLSQLADSGKGNVKIGAKVEKVFRKVSDTSEKGAIAYGYKFRVVK